MFKGNCAIFSDYNQLTVIIISILHPLVKLMKLFELPLLQHFLQNHVRDVHLALSLLVCGIAFQDVGYGDVKHRVVLRLLPPFVVAVNVREAVTLRPFRTISLSLN